MGFFCWSWVDLLDLKRLWRQVLEQDEKHLLRPDVIPGLGKCGSSTHAIRWRYCVGKHILPADWWQGYNGCVQLRLRTIARAASRQRCLVSNSRRVKLARKRKVLQHHHPQVLQKPIMPTGFLLLAQWRRIMCEVDRQVFHFRFIKSLCQQLDHDSSSSKRSFIST